MESGLAQQPKQLPAWLLYDAEGSRLFAEICNQPEYTITRTEITLLEQQATEIATAVGQGVVVEFGIGTARKVDPLLQALRPAAFMALDISRTALEDSLSALAQRHQDVAPSARCDGPLNVCPVGSKCVTANEHPHQ